MGAPRWAGHRWWRWAGAVLLLLLALHAGRVALVRTEAAARPGLALAVWPGHPDASFSSALAAIGRSAREGRPPAPAVVAMVERAAVRAPLAPEPLWVAAAVRMEERDFASARRLLDEAIRRDPRAPAGRFLLADLAIRQGDLELALRELAALERRLGGVTAGFAPALVAYLRQPGAAGEAGPLLAGNPPLRDAVMKALAGAPGDFPILLALACPGDERAPWYPSVITRMLEQGQVAEVRLLHRRVLPSDELAGSTLSRWSRAATGNPFAWRFPQGRGGMAEVGADGVLRLIHYGREENVLAEHLLLLAPGSYRLADRFAAPPPAGAFEWRLRCFAGDGRLLQQPAGAGQSAMLTVPANCPAQSLSLVGNVTGVSGTSRADLLAVRLERAGAGR